GVEHAEVAAPRAPVGRNLRFIVFHFQLDRGSQGRHRSVTPPKVVRWSPGFSRLKPGLQRSGKDHYTLKRRGFSRTKTTHSWLLSPRRGKQWGRTSVPGSPGHQIRWSPVNS